MGSLSTCCGEPVSGSKIGWPSVATRLSAVSKCLCQPASIGDGACGFSPLSCWSPGCSAWPGWSVEWQTTPETARASASGCWSTKSPPAPGSKSLCSDCAAPAGCRRCRTGRYTRVASQPQQCEPGPFYFCGLFHSSQPLINTSNARRDFGHPHAARIASGEEDLDGLGAGQHRKKLTQASRFQSR